LTHINRTLGIRRGPLQDSGGGSQRGPDISASRPVSSLMPRGTREPAPDILVNNASGPAPRDFRELDDEDWEKGLNPNMIAPIMLIKATVDRMANRG
jgi:NAD(P)-dependent dehydrogenase (short-subunit alcohol dehydrogenase family)